MPVVNGEELPKFNCDMGVDDIRAYKYHCTCWYDGGACCLCKAPALPEEAENQRGKHPIFG